MPGAFGWRMPVGAVLALDLRPAAQRSDPGLLAPEPRALFVMQDGFGVGPGFEVITDDPAGALTAARRDSLRALFGVSTSTSTKFDELLWELWTLQADPDGLRTTQPLGATHRGVLRLQASSPHVGGVVLKRDLHVGLGMAEWPLVREMARRGYRKVRQGVTLGRSPAGLHQKFLGALALKHGLDYDTAMAEFIAPDLPRENPKRPTTTLTESFPGSSGTLGGDQTWTETAGTWSNVSGVGAAESGSFADNYARCEADLSTDDMRGQAIRVNNGNSGYGGALVRYNAAEDTAYGISSNLTLNDYYGNEHTAGVSTDIITSELGGSITPPSTDAVEIDGSALEIFEGANTRGSTTDASITANLRGGLYASYSSVADDPTFDDWQVNDLAAASGSPVAGVNRGLVNRGLVNGGLVNRSMTKVNGIWQQTKELWRPRLVPVGIAL